MEIHHRNSRQIELDLLRIIAMVAVVIVHVCGMKTHELQISDPNWKELTFIAGIMTWQIPAFVMISGRFFLDPERHVSSKRVVKAVARLCVVFVIWDLVYQIYYILSGVYSQLNWKGVLVQAIQGPYHFWYLYMLVGVYLLIPFLRKLAQSKTLMEYFIILFLTFEFVSNYCVELPVIGSMIDRILEFTSFHFTLGYAGYFLAGFYFYKYPISKKLEIMVYICSVVFLFGAAGLTVYKSACLGVHQDWFTAYLLPNVAIESFGVYTFFVKRVAKWKFSSRARGVIEKLAEYSSGIYFIHALVVEIVGLIGCSPIAFSSFFAVPLVAFLVIIVSFFSIFVIRKIPKIGNVIA